jgi:hypothetical protein
VVDTAPAENLTAAVVPTGNKPAHYCCALPSTKKRAGPGGAAS